MFKLSSKVKLIFSEKQFEKEFFNNKLHALVLKSFQSKYRFSQTFVLKEWLTLKCCPILPSICLFAIYEDI